MIIASLFTTALADDAATAMIIPPEQYAQWEEYYADFFADSYKYCYDALIEPPAFGYPEYGCPEGLNADAKYAFVTLDPSLIPLLYVKFDGSDGLQFLFAKESGAIRRLMEGMYRNGFAIMKTGIIHHTWSDSAFENGGSFIMIDNNYGEYLIELSAEYEFEESPENNENGITEGDIERPAFHFFNDADQLYAWLNSITYYTSETIDDSLFWKDLSANAPARDVLGNASINTNKVNVRTSPSSSVNNALGFVMKGDRVEILESVYVRKWWNQSFAQWFYVRAVDTITGYEQAGRGIEAYVMAEYVDID
jgi:hypothetical protein